MLYKTPQQLTACIYPNIRRQLFNPAKKMLLTGFPLIGFSLRLRLPFPVYLFPLKRIDLTRDNPKRGQPISSQKSVFCLASGVSFFFCCLVRPSSRPRGVRYRGRSGLVLRCWSLWACHFLLAGLWLSVALWFCVVLLRWATDSTKDSQRQRQAVAGVVQIVTFVYAIFSIIRIITPTVKQSIPSKPIKGLHKKHINVFFCGLDSFIPVGVLRLIAEKNSPICPYFVCYN